MPPETELHFQPNNDEGESKDLNPEAYDETRDVVLPDRIASLDLYQIAEERWTEQIRQLQEAGELIDFTEITADDEAALEEARQAHLDLLDRWYFWILRQVFVEQGRDWPPTDEEVDDIDKNPLQT